MDSFISFLSSVFDLCNDVKILGISLVTWFVIFIVISALALFIRGNK